MLKLVRVVLGFIVSRRYGHLSDGILLYNEFLKPLSHWTATVLRQLATDIASGSQSSLETVASDS